MSKPATSRTSATGRSSWNAVRDRRMAEPGAQDAYHAARPAYDLGAAVRPAYDLGAAVRAPREQHGWTQTQLATAAGMTQSAVARFEAGGTIPTLPVLDRLTRALDADLTISVTPRTDVA